MLSSNQQNKKGSSSIIWISLAILVGIGIGYVMTEGSVFAYGQLHNQLLKFTTSNDNTNSQSDILIPKKEIPTDKVISDKMPDVSKNITDQINIGFVGDIVPGMKVPSDIFSNVSQYTEKPDIMIGNLEGVVTNDIFSSLKCKNNSSNCFSFNGGSYFLELAAKAGFDVLNIANNHFNDYGKNGQIETVQEIRSNGITESGLKNEINYIKVKNLTLGIIGFSTYAWTNNMNDTKEVKAIISTAKENSDIVVVIFHGGKEGTGFVNTPNETEYYLGENRGNLREFAHNAIDAGADIVLGSGPHVLRGMEWYKNKLIAYSLGNFASANTLSVIDSLKDGAILNATLDKSGSFVSGSVSFFEINKDGIPNINPGNTNIITMDKLSSADFGQEGIILNSAGSIVAN